MTNFFSFNFIIPFKQYFYQLKYKKMATIHICKKRKFKASLVFNMVYEIVNNKLKITNINNMKNGFETLF